MNLTKQEIEMLEATKSENDWNAACDKIKEARGGEYPPDWWPLVMLSGRFNRIQMNWN